MCSVHIYTVAGAREIFLKIFNISLISFLYIKCGMLHDHSGQADHDMKVMMITMIIASNNEDDNDDGNDVTMMMMTYDI